MKKLLKHRPSAALVISCLALFVALGGTGYAAAKINGASLKNKSVTGSKLKNDTITGTQVKESKLGTVPSAAHATSADTATTAGNAGTVGGKSAADLATPKAYGHFRTAAGVATLDSTRTSSSVTSVTRTSTGQFCVQLNFTPKAATVTEDSYQGGDRLAHVDLDPASACSLTITTIDPDGTSTGTAVDGNAYFVAW
ncbi:MAG: hypothetical protein QM648_09835 [Solirubrobacterales bacterium]